MFAHESKSAVIVGLPNPNPNPNPGLEHRN